jgi:acid phosphatase family membrane protein YuiD
MNLLGLLSNPVLIAGLTAWGLAQVLKVPLNYLVTRTWDWVLLLRVGGMPSSHSALIASITHAIGLFVGFDTPLFALALAIAIIVIYDATGIRRQAGLHAEIINAMIRDLTRGHPLKEEQLKEVLGHTPLEAVGGTLLGIVTAQAMWFIWR